ncbi:MAG: signal recognition particle protein [Actinomycetes bacterium]|nr:signal recognition particle protein [Actinomycetes bacterium]
MFDNLADRLQSVFAGLKSKGRLSESDVDAAMRQIRLALLEADVNFQVVKDFTARVRESAIGADVLNSLTPGQQVIKIVLDELTRLLGGAPSKLVLSNRIPNVIMLVGLQGSGKTTAAAKLAFLLRKKGKKPLLVAADVHRPAAVDQLEALGRELQIPVWRGSASDAADAVAVARTGVRAAIDDMRDVVIVDTAGRLHVDEDMMAEAAAIKAAVKPDQILMVVDAMTGQDAVNVASAFAEKLDFDGLIMSKLDGDARGGAALSVREVTGKPIKFASMGEKPSSLEEFYPDRMAKRILGMGDVVSLIERASEAALEDELSDEDAARMAQGKFTFDDFLTSIKQMRKMGGLSAIAKLLPGMGGQQLPVEAMDESMVNRTEAIIFSMTPGERAHPRIINGQRRARIAAGSGTTVVDVNRLMKQFEQTQKMMRQMTGMAGGKKGKKAGRGKRGGNNLPFSFQ